jgi:hypothetical protein
MFPVSYPAGGPTSHEYGEWVVAGEQGARWFIPKKGVKGYTAAELTQAAFDQRTPEQKAQVARHAAGKTAATIAFRSLLTVLAAMGRADAPGLWEDVY